MELALANYLIDQLKGLGFDYISPASFLATDPSGSKPFTVLWDATAIVAQGPSEPSSEFGFRIRLRTAIRAYSQHLESIRTILDHDFPAVPDPHDISLARQANADDTDRFWQADIEVLFTEL